MSYAFDIFYYFNLYKRLWHVFVIVIVISMTGTGFLLSRRPPTYSSTVIILTEAGGAKGGSSLGGILGGITNLMPSSKYIVSAMLKSRRMENDIQNRFKLDEKPEIWWGIEVREVMAGLNVTVQGSDPKYTKMIANFAVDNLDRINAELDITPNKPMVKVLDRAAYGSEEPKYIPKKTIASGLFSFLALSLYIFFWDSVKRLRKS